MKKLFPIALLLCLSFSMSSFAPVNHHMSVVKIGTLAVPFPLTGQVPGWPGAGQPATLLDYYIGGGGDVPLFVTFSYMGAQVAGPYSFSNGGSGNVYYASGQGMQTETGVIYVKLTVGGTNGYTLEFATVA